MSATETPILHAREILPAGRWQGVPADRVALDYDARHRRRFRYIADGGTAFLLDLPRATLLNDGDGLRLDDGRIIAIRAADEALVEVRAADAATLVRLAWHIGNRHLPAQLSADAILIRDDHVIVAMLHGLGATTRALRAPFTPENGAYAGGHGGHAHGHGHEPAAHAYVFVGGHGH